ncbi:hypothetical protein EAF00_004673 [Botryotinia globosa]|nr:hypothetical protein EAF00_004673 [Botryotinia globosa]
MPHFDRFLASMIVDRHNAPSVAFSASRTTILGSLSFALLRLKLPKSKCFSSSNIRPLCRSTIRLEGSRNPSFISTLHRPINC